MAATCSTGARVGMQGTNIRQESLHDSTINQSDDKEGKRIPSSTSTKVELKRLHDSGDSGSQQVLWAKRRSGLEAELWQIQALPKLQVLQMLRGFFGKTAVAEEAAGDAGDAGAAAGASASGS